MGTQSRTVEAIIARIASANHGVATREQLLAAGVSAKQIHHRLQVGSLIAVFPGVYRVGHAAPSTLAHYLAAVRACGNQAALYGPAAGHLLRLTKGDPPLPHVMTRTERHVKGIRTKRVRKIEHVTTFNRIRTTNVALTLIDLAAVLSPQALARACHEAGVRYRTTPGQVQAILRPNSPGAASLRRVLTGDEHVTLSKLERAFLELLRAHGLPVPITNKVASGRRVDCRWPEHRLTVELCGYIFHNSRHAWGMDHRRAREAYKRDEEFRSYTYEDVFEDPADMLRELRELLAT
jgi:putative AbiEi antitoxin of type IV toxin-antitoxin system